MNNRRHARGEWQIERIGADSVKMANGEWIDISTVCFTWRISQRIADAPFFDPYETLIDVSGEVATFRYPSRRAAVKGHRLLRQFARNMRRQPHPPVKGVPPRWAAGGPPRPQSTWGGRSNGIANAGA